MGTAALVLAIVALFVLGWIALRLNAQSARLSLLVETTQGQLQELRTALQTGLTNAANLAAGAQTAVSNSLSQATQLFGELKTKLEGVEEAGKNLAQASRTLETLLSGARTRGALGEASLEAILADALPPPAYEPQYRFRTGAQVDAVVRLGDKLLPIDSKFPLDAFRRLAEAADDKAKEQARREFASAVRSHVDDIASKYILPAEATLDIAFMFIASESVYYELLMTSDAKGRLEEYCRSKRVFPVSPNTLHAYLLVILMGLKGMQIEENAKRLLATLAGLQGQLNEFAEIYVTLGTHLKNARDRYEEATPKLADTQRVLKDVATGVLPGPS